METQVYFGNYNLQNTLSTVYVGEWRNASAQLVQTLPIARGRGVSVVNTKQGAKSVQIAGKINVDGTSVASIEALTKKFDTIFNEKGLRYLRSVPNYIEVIPTNTATGWTGSSDTANVAVDSVNFQTGSSSLGFDIDVSASGDNKAVLTYTGSAVDLSAYSDTGNFEFTLNIPDAYYITSVDFRLGNDSSNYYSASLNSNYEGNGFENGYNLFSVDWSTITQTGTVNDATIDYCVITINYDASAVDITGCFVDAIQWVDEDRVRNYPVYVEGEIQKEGKHYNISFTNFSIGFLNYKGYAIGTHSKTLFAVTGITGLSSTQTFTLDGSIPIVPEHTISITTATGLGNMTVQNLQDINPIVITPATISATDIYKVGGTSNIVTKNGQSVPFTGKIPTFSIIGKKRATLSLGASSPTTQSYTVNDTDRYADSTYIYKACSFVASATGTVTSVTLRIRETDTGAFDYGQPRVWIYTNSAGNPGTIIGTGGNIFTNSSTLVNATTTGSLSASVTSGTTYWVVFQEYFRSGVNINNYAWAGDSALGNAGSTSKRGTTAFSWSAMTTDADLYYSIVIQPSPAWNVDWTATYRKLYAS